MRQSGTIEMHGEDEKTFEVQDPKLCKEDPATASLNPWSLRCHREQLAKMRSGKSNGVHSILFSPAIVGTHLRIALTEANLILKVIWLSKIENFRILCCFYKYKI